MIIISSCIQSVSVVQYNEASFVRPVAASQCSIGFLLESFHDISIMHTITTAYIGNGYIHKNIKSK